MYGLPFRVVLQISMTYAWFLQPLRFTRCPLCDSPWWGTGATINKRSKTLEITMGPERQAFTMLSRLDQPRTVWTWTPAVGTPSDVSLRNHQRKETSVERPSTPAKNFDNSNESSQVVWRLSWTTINVEHFTFCRM